MKIKGNKWFRNLSGVFAMVGYLICLKNFNITADHPEGCILWVAEAFAVSLLMGYLGLELELWLNRKNFKAIGRKSILFGIVASIVLGAAIGAAGQTLYALEIQKYTEDEIIEGKKDRANIALMADYSGSMDGILQSYLEATDELIDSLDEKNSLQFAAFTSVDIDKNTHATDMLPMTAQNKKIIKDFYDKLPYMYGYSTNFDIAIDFAVDSLISNHSDSIRSVVLILTDCQGFVSQDVLDRCKQNNCELYVLTLKNELTTINQLEQVADKYFELEPNPDGSINVSDAVEALEEAIDGTTTVTETKKKLALSMDMIVSSDDLTVFRVIITMLFFGLSGAAAGFIYYGFEDIKKLAVNFLLGVFAAMVMFIYTPAGIVLLLVVGLGNFNSYTVTEDLSDV